MSKKYEVTEWVLLHVYVMRTVEVEAESRDEAYEIADEIIYDECRAAINPIGVIDDSDTYNSEIKEIE